MRFFREHIGLQRCVAWVKQHPGLLGSYAVILVLVFWYLSGWLQSSPVRQRSQGPTETTLVTPLPFKRDQEIARSLKDQNDLIDLQKQVKQGEQAQRDLKQQLVAMDNDHKQQRTQLSQQIEGLKQQVIAQNGQGGRQQATKTTPVSTGPTAREKQLQEELAKLRQQQRPAQPASNSESYGRMQSYEPKNPMNFPMPPSANRAETPYLGIGCVGTFTLVTGGDTTVATDRSRPVLLSFTEPFRCASRLQGPQQLPVTTEIPIQGCLALAGLKADMAAGRAIGETLQLACTMPDNAYFERPFKAYVVGGDGNNGLIGDVVRHDSQKLFAASLSAVMQEASALLTAARSNIVISGNPGGQQYFSGIQSGFNQMTTYFLEQARNLTPTVFVHRGQQGYAVVLEGLPMEGMPMVNLMSTGR